MARPLAHKAVTLVAGLALFGSVVACGGGGAVPTAHAAGGGAQSGSLAARTPGATGAAAGSSSGTITTTTYQNIQPLTFYTDGSSLSFLTASVSVATVLSPLNSGPLVTSQLTIPISCNQPGSGISTLDGGRRSAAAASPTPPPTPSPTDLPVSSCVIVAYAAGSSVGIPVSGYGSIDGSTLIFAPLSPGPSYALGTTYTFYVAYATTVVSTATPGPTATPRPTPSPDQGGCSGRDFKHDDASKSDRDDHDCDHDGDRGHKGDHRCDGRSDNGHHNGNDDTRNEHDNGNHKDCGYHTGDDHDHHGGDGDDHDHH